MSWQWRISHIFAVSLSQILLSAIFWVIYFDIFGSFYSTLWPLLPIIWASWALNRIVPTYLPFEFDSLFVGPTMGIVLLIRIRYPTLSCGWIFFRLTPVYAFVIFYYATLFYHIGSGPLWNLIIQPEVEDCRDNWWTNLLYVNNYVNAKHMVSANLIFRITPHFCVDFQTLLLNCKTTHFVTCVDSITPRPPAGCRVKKK